jgi:hypothetical protein
MLVPQEGKFILDFGTVFGLLVFVALALGVHLRRALLTLLWMEMYFLEVVYALYTSVYGEGRISREGLF